MTDFMTEDFQKYQKGVEYLQSLDLYDTVDRNERFYAGDQWGDLSADARSKLMGTPVFPLFKRIINYFISSIMSYDATISYAPDGVASEPEDEQSAQLIESAQKLTHFAANRWEKNQMNTLCHRALLDAALSGNMCAHVYWDAMEKSRGNAPGNFKTELVDSGNLIMADPTSTDVQKQRWIIVAGREMVDTLRDECKENGGDSTAIVADNDTENQAGDLSEKEPDGTKATYLIKYWKDSKTGTVHYRKSTRNAVIKDDIDTGLTLYPISVNVWDRRKGTWIGEAIGTHLIDNQIYINKGYAMVMSHLASTAFGKTVYKEEAFPKGFNNEPGEAIGVSDDMPMDDIVKQLPVGQLNNSILTVLDNTISLTKELLGASDAALGEVKPNNTSAIIALQQASAMPLETIKLNLYQFIEDIGQIWMDYALNYLEGDYSFSFTENGKTVVDTINVEAIKDELFNCRIDVGASSYFNKAASVNALDNLLLNQQITFIEYLERIPDGIIPDTDGLIQARQQQEQASYSNDDYEAMTMFLESLPPDQQADIKALPEGEAEKALLSQMKQAGVF